MPISGLRATLSVKNSIIWQKLLSLYLPGVKTCKIHCLTAAFRWLFVIVLDKLCEAVLGSGGEMILNGKFVTGLALGLSAVFVTMTTCNLSAFADSESGGFVWGGGSESGGATGTGSDSESGGFRGNGGSTESGGFYNNGSTSESGGERGNGSSSESGGMSELGSSTESGGVFGTGSTPPVYVKSYNWKNTAK
jgi:hypothetical protein